MAAAAAAPDSLFPARQSAPGKMLAHLITLDVPGITLDVAEADLAGGAGLDKAEAAGALNRLEADGFIVADRDPSTGAVRSVTVMIAPPGEEYGVTTAWGAGQPVPPAAGAVSMSDTDQARSGAAADSTTDTASESQSVPLPAAAPSVAGRSGRGRRQTVPASAGSTARTPRAGASGEATQAAGAEAGAGSTATDAPRGAADGNESAGGESSQRQTKRPSGPAVDETAVLRGFVERFEQLLAEIDEWKRRAQAAEERATTAEKQLRAAERRAQTAEERLAVAQERAQAWAELTRRMQELARKADAPGRGRAGAKARGE